jgi:hypothetical protein
LFLKYDGGQHWLLLVLPEFLLNSLNFSWIENQFEVQSRCFFSSHIFQDDNEHCPDCKEMCNDEKYSVWLMKNCPLTCNFCEKDKDHEDHKDHNDHKDHDDQKDHDDHKDHDDQKDHDDHKDHDDKEKPCVWAIIADMKIPGKNTFQNNLSDDFSYHEMECLSFQFI